MSAVPATQPDILVVFRVGPVWLSAPVDRVEGVLPLPEALAPLPQAAPCVLGFFDHRGETATVLDVRCKLGLAAEPASGPGRLILVRAPSGLLAFQVDELEEVAPARRFQWAAAPAAVDASLFQATLSHEGRLILHTDFEVLERFSGASGVARWVQRQAPPSARPRVVEAVAGEAPPPAQDGSPDAAPQAREEAAATEVPRPARQEPSSVPQGRAGPLAPEEGTASSPVAEADDTSASPAAATFTQAAGEGTQAVRRRTTRPVRPPPRSRPVGPPPRLQAALGRRPPPPPPAPPPCSPEPAVDAAKVFATPPAARPRPRPSAAPAVAPTRAPRRLERTPVQARRPWPALAAALLACVVGLNFAILAQGEEAPAPPSAPAAPSVWLLTELEGGRRAAPLPPAVLPAEEAPGLSAAPYLPWSAPVSMPPFDPRLLQVHVVDRGETLWELAGRYLDDPRRYPELARLSNIRDPDLILPGEFIYFIPSPRTP